MTASKNGMMIAVISSGTSSVDHGAAWKTWPIKFEQLLDLAFVR